MPKRSSKTEDANQIAARIIARLEDGVQKNPAAVELGRLGGIKGGPARARKLSAKRRKAIARKAAKARWKGHLLLV